MLRLIPWDRPLYPFSGLARNHVGCCKLSDSSAVSRLRLAAGVPARAEAAVSPSAILTADADCDGPVGAERIWTRALIWLMSQIRLTFCRWLQRPGLWSIRPLL
jgi:hypothetical protein